MFFDKSSAVPSIVNSKIPSQSEAGTEGNHGDTIFDSSSLIGSSDFWSSTASEGPCITSGEYLGGGNTGGGGGGEDDCKY